MGCPGSHSVLPSFYEVWEFVSLGSECLEWADLCGNARLTPLSGLVWLWSAQVLPIQTRGRGGGSGTSLAAPGSTSLPFGGQQTQRNAKRGREKAPAGPGRCSHVLIRSLSARLQNPGKESGELIVMRKNKRLGNLRLESIKKKVQRLPKRRRGRERAKRKSTESPQNTWFRVNRDRSNNPPPPLSLSTQPLRS